MPVSERYRGGRVQISGKNELVQVGNRVHTFENDTDEIVEFLVFRFVPDGTDKREMIREDKRLCSVAEDALGAAGK